MLFRTFSFFSALYTIGSPAFDAVRPPEIDIATKGTYEAFAPAVKIVNDTFWKYAGPYVPREAQQVKNLDKPTAKLERFFNGKQA